MNLIHVIASFLNTQADSGDYVVRLRGLPYSAKTKDILQFLSDCQVANGEKSVHFTFVSDGRPSGEAFVELLSEEDVSKALAHHNEHMGRRYVEMFRASRGQMEWDLRSENKVYGEGGAGTTGTGGGGNFGIGGVVRLRGLPYGCAEEEVRKFFSGWQPILGVIAVVLLQSINCFYITCIIMLMISHVRVGCIVCVCKCTVYMYLYVVDIKFRV